MKKQKKFVAIVLSMSLAMGVPVYAYDNEVPHVAGEHCNWTPDFSSIESHGALGEARCRSDFSFDQATYNIVCEAYTEDDYYFTVEHSTIAEYPLSASEDLFSFLPNPHFDYDDDLGGFLNTGDDRYDEVEVVCLSPEDIRTDYNYYFASWWNIVDSMTYGAFDIITQLSEPASDGEYNERCSDYIDSTGFQYSYNTASVDLNYTAEDRILGSTEVLGEENLDCSTSEIGKFVSRINDLDELEEYKNDIENQYKTIKSNNSSYSSNRERTMIEQNEKIDAVITFTEPVSLEYLESLLNDKCSLVNYEAKMVNSDNDWMTMFSKRMDQDELMYVATTMSGEEDLVFCGVTSATVNIPVNDNTYDILCAEEKIYLVDMSEYIIKMQLNDFTVDVDVSDCYYYLEKWN